MRMKPKTLAGLIILLLFISLIPPVSGDEWPEEQTRHIIEHPPGTDGDMFVTEAGLGFHSSLVTVLDPNMDIYGYLFFKDMKINFWEYLVNATLRLHTASTLDFDNESSFTIYGIPDYRYFGMGEWGYGSPAEIMNAPLTSAHVNYNSSQFYGSQWHEIDVTNIVQELKSNPYYDGPGWIYSDPGDQMAFIIQGAGGHDSRWFYDVSAGNGYEAQLHLHWDYKPSPPWDIPEGSDYIGEYGNWSIWSYTPEATWFNFSTFTQLGGSPKESDISDYAFKVSNMYTDSDSYFRRDYDTYRDDSIPTLNVLFGLNLTALYWSVTNSYVTLWSVSENHIQSTDYSKGFVFTIEIRDLYGKFRAWTLDAGVLKDSLMYGPQIDSGELNEIKYFNITLNMETFDVISEVYEDYEMTILNGTWADTFENGPAWDGGTWLTYEYVNSPFEPSGPNTGYSGWHLSREEDLSDIFYVHDHGTNTTFTVDDVDEDGDIDEDDAEDWIDNYDPDPEDPDPAGEWSTGPGGETGAFTRFRMRLWFLIIGFGCFFGPVLFFSWRRPSGYYLLCGAIVMLIGVGLLLSIAQV